MEILRTENLTKHYGAIQAVHGLNMSLQEGQVLGILGPNGSGKTTTLGMTLGTIIPTSGIFQWWEKSHPNKQIGTLLETPNFFSYLSAIDNLKVVQKIKNTQKDDLNQILKTVGLYDRRTSKFKTYSLGMKQRLALASTLIGDPKVLILDEPTNGLDPKGIVEIRDIILEIAQRGKTILIASHILDEVEKICSDVIILKNGRVLAQGSVTEIIGGENLFSISAENHELLGSALSEMEGVEHIENKTTHYLIQCDKNINGADINQFLVNHSLIAESISPIKRRLEDEFLKLVK